MLSSVFEYKIKKSIFKLLAQLLGVKQQKNDIEFIFNFLKT